MYTKTLQLQLHCYLRTEVRSSMLKNLNNPCAAVTKCRWEGVMRESDRKQKSFFGSIAFQFLRGERALKISRRIRSRSPLGSSPSSTLTHICLPHLTNEALPAPTEPRGGSYPVLARRGRRGARRNKSSQILLWTGERLCRQCHPKERESQITMRSDTKPERNVLCRRNSH